MLLKKVTTTLGNSRSIHDPLFLVRHYDFGKITVIGYDLANTRASEREYITDIIILPTGVIENWRRKQGHLLLPEDLERVFAASPLTVLIVGTGYYGWMEVPEHTKQYIEEAGIELYVLETSPAVDFYNGFVDTQDDDYVAAALHLTC